MVHVCTANLPIHRGCSDQIRASDQSAKGVLHESYAHERWKSSFAFHEPAVAAMSSDLARGEGLEVSLDRSESVTLHIEPRGSCCYAAPAFSRGRQHSARCRRRKGPCHMSPQAQLGKAGEKGRLHSVAWTKFDRQLCTRAQWHAKLLQWSTHNSFVPALPLLCS